MMITDALRETWARNGWAPHLPVLTAPVEPLIPAAALARLRRCATCTDSSFVVEWKGTSLEPCFVDPAHGPGEPV